MAEPTTQARWEGRNQDKDGLRSEVWTILEEGGHAVGSPWSHIPNYVGAELAAARLAELPIWKQARVVKSNPDTAQAPVRLRALQEGKLLYMPIPELKDNYPFVLLDPAALGDAGIAFEDASTVRGGVKHGRKVRLEDMLPLDLVVTGCVAVTRSGARIGKGGGFADLELGMLREVGLVKPETPVITTVHSVQVVADVRIPMMPHDSPLHWIITPDEVIETRTTFTPPQGIYWDAVQPDQFRDIPFLAELRDKLTQARRGSS